uniref:Uncharacterized protein n=1 Tax=Kalanchoe fedtschenkoi TaxID=63787 RepID=A0A7N0TI65_KALFE
MPPLHLCFFTSVVFLLLGFSWCISYESMMEEKMDRLKLFFMISPLLRMLLGQFLSRNDEVRVPFNLRIPDQESIHGEGRSPWGVAVLLVFLRIMVSLQSSIRESWFPLLSKQGETVVASSYLDMWPLASAQ